MKRNRTWNKITITLIIAVCLVGAGIYVFLNWRDLSKFKLANKNTVSQPDKTDKEVIEKMDKLNEKVDNLFSWVVGLAQSKETVVPQTEEILYENGSYKFSFKLSKSFEIVEEKMAPGDGVSLQINEKVTNYVSKNMHTDVYYYNSGFKSLEDIEKSYEIVDEVSMEDITVDGVAGHKYFVGGLFSGYKIFVFKNGKSLIIDIYPDSETNTYLMDKISETFKFPTN